MWDQQKNPSPLSHARNTSVAGYQGEKA
jgi:hypothetical protein